MAVVTRRCGDVPCFRVDGQQNRTLQNGWTVRRIWDITKTQLCTVAISLTLFNSVRLPREAVKYGEVPYLIVYSFWLLVIGLPSTLLQLAMGQISQQDPVGVWRAVPILRGVGHLKLLTSFVCCVYNILYVALSAAYIIWIAKGSFPLRECAKLHLTPYGYENKMNASECFKLLCLRKSLKISLVLSLPIAVTIIAVLCTFLADSAPLSTLVKSCEHWSPITQPYMWHSAMIQALLSSHVVSGYLISSGGSVYRKSDVRWISIFVVITNLVAGWLWVLFWESIGGSDDKDKGIIAVLILIYQSSVTERRTKEWPILAFVLVFLSGIITVLALLFPIFDKFHRVSSFYWRLFASTLSAVGSAVSVAVLAHGLGVATMLDELVVPVLAAFTTALEIVGFVFIYGWFYLSVDIQFITGSRLPCFYLVSLWSAPVFLLGVTGWWLRSLLRATWGQGQTLWPLVGAFAAIIIIMVVMAAIAVAKEEQYNLVTKIASAFRPSRLWGPEEPMIRYMWMSRRFNDEKPSNDDEFNSETNDYPYIISKNSPKNNEVKYNEDWMKFDDTYQRIPKSYVKSNLVDDDDLRFKKIDTTYPSSSIARSKKKKKTEEKFRSPNICIAKDELGGPLNCNCNRHFTLNVPDLRSNETATSL
ncbi:sodium-dependent nutrient amino acid transporter 1-like isoform X2 [Epargyreus clarus]|uniref:sodium-dependent nutrient amino acid transporter 1-like isoform X2 n=1 Tax=Epargyreus clarus TaxID=520877 RepID=UPI003C2E1FC6